MTYLCWLARKWPKILFIDLLCWLARKIQQFLVIVPLSFECQIKLNETSCLVQGITQVPQIKWLS
uniref:Putative ovule protein n=1 Tax=Solanum chacoense TaxID=4108 RepID=A0A0V0HHR2_SOLCH